MAKFSRKAVQTTSGTGNTGTTVDPSAWAEWNRYIDSCNPATAVMAKGKARKEYNPICRVSLVMDMGLPPAADSMWETKCALPESGEAYSQEELDWKKANPTHDFVWHKEWNDNIKGMHEVRKQTSPSYPQQEYGVCIDVLDWLVDYSKHPYSTSDEPQVHPYRISLNGIWSGDIQKPIVFQGHWKTGQVSDKNLIYKICKAAGLEQELIDSQFDIGTVAEAVCTFKVVCTLEDKGEVVYLNTSASTPARINDIKERGGSIYSAQEQIDDALKAEGLQPFVGILLDMDEYTDEMFEMLGVNDTHKYIKRASTSKKWTISGTSATGDYSFEKGIMIQGEDGKEIAIDYSDTPFAKAYEEWKAKQGNSTSSQATGSSETKVKEQPKQEVKESVKVVEEVPSIDDFSDDIPF